MTYYLEILGPRPYENNVDDNDRTQWSMNLEAQAEGPAGQWAYDLQKILSDAGLSTIAAVGRDTFIGRGATLPAGNGPYIRIVEEGSVPSEETHNGGEREMLSASIHVSAKSRAVAETRAFAVWRAINRTRDTVVSP